MFSLDKFYDILHDNLVSKFVNTKSMYFHPFGTYDSMRYIISDYNQLSKGYQELTYEIRTNPNRVVTVYYDWTEETCFRCFFYDQEPFYETTPRLELLHFDDYSSKKLFLIANSEKSAAKQDFIKQHPYFQDWYYFFHGFAALDWFRDFQYYDARTFQKFDKVFICFNNLISNYRSYRLHLIANLVEDKTFEHGHVSFFLKDKYGSWRDEIEKSSSPLSVDAKIKIHKNIGTLKDPLTIDTDDPAGELSAKVSVDLLTSALWHIVTETIYFQPKLHLTEKIFKPIVVKRPFILVGAAGNLAYLKSYGFKTFDRWIDESYDDEQDNFIRIEKITAEIKKLCALSRPELEQMHAEMQEVLEYNFQHFYGNFKEIIVNELVDNFCGVLTKFNNGRDLNNHSQYHHRFELPEGHAEAVKRRLLS